MISLACLPTPRSVMRGGQRRPAEASGGQPQTSSRGLPLRSLGLPRSADPSCNQMAATMAK
jgi:hypothetical protein